MTFCYNCRVEKTPMWRKILDTGSNKVVTLCNACGIYYKTKGSHRPRSLISKNNIVTLSDLVDKISKEEEAKANKLEKKSETPNSGTANQRPKVLVNNDVKLENLNIIQCSNCNNTNTSIWRRDTEGNPICNACGLFYKKKGFHRKVKTSTSCEDVFLSIEENLIRFTPIKRRNRSSSETKPLLKKSRLSFNSSDHIIDGIHTGALPIHQMSSGSAIESSPETPTPTITSISTSQTLKTSIHSQSSEIINSGISSNKMASSSPDLVKSDLGNYYKYDSFNVPYENNTKVPELSYSLPRISTPASTISLPPISSIFNISLDK